MPQALGQHKDPQKIFKEKINGMFNETLPTKLTQVQKFAL